jgi:hypothetical protein
MYGMSIKVTTVDQEPTAGNEMTSGPASQHLVFSLYETLESPQKNLDAFLLLAAKAFRSRGAQILHQDMLDFRHSFSAVRGCDWSQETYQSYADLIPEDPRLSIFLSKSHQAVHCRMAPSDAEHHSSRVYQEDPGEAGLSTFLA